MGIFNSISELKLQASEVDFQPVLKKGHLKYEPQHDKTNKLSVRPGKTQISLDIRPVWSESSLSDLSFYWAHSFCWFCHVAADIML